MGQIRRFSMKSIFKELQNSSKWPFLIYLDFDRETNDRIS